MSLGQRLAWGLGEQAWLAVRRHVAAAARRGQCGQGGCLLLQVDWAELTGGPGGLCRVQVLGATSPSAGHLREGRPPQPGPGVQVAGPGVRGQTQVLAVPQVAFW